MTRLMTGSAGTLGFITEATWRVATIPQRCAAITAEGSLAACAAAARAVIQSDFSPIYVAAVPVGDGTADPDPGKFKIVVGFEGFSNIVDYQIEKCGALLAKSKLQALEHGDYPVLEGRFSENLRAYCAITVLSIGPIFRWIEWLNLSGSSMAACQRQRFFWISVAAGFFCGTDDLSDDQWMHICDLAARHDGYGLWKKLRMNLRNEMMFLVHPGPSGRLCTGLKRALDPDNIFAPGSLPGKV